jgi:hypothetical protein
MEIARHSMNWLPKQSTYDYVSRQTEKRRAAHEAFLNSQDTLSSTFSSIFTTLSQGQSTNAAQAALARVTSGGGKSADAIKDALDQISATRDRMDDASADSGETGDTPVDILA